MDGPRRKVHEGWHTATFVHRPASLRRRAGAPPHIGADPRRPGGRGRHPARRATGRGGHLRGRAHPHAGAHRQPYPRVPRVPGASDRLRRHHRVGHVRRARGIRQPAGAGGGPHRHGRPAVGGHRGHGAGRPSQPVRRAGLVPPVSHRFPRFPPSPHPRTPGTGSESGSPKDRTTSRSSPPHSRPSQACRTSATTLCAP
jgi:hypothetical protein